MKVFENVFFDKERALYGSRDTVARNCVFDGPANGESAFKECSNIEADGCFFNLRYPFWHDHGLKIKSSEMTELCRAALWYSDHIRIIDTKIHGIKALRECSNIVINECDIISPEFGWSSKNIEMRSSTAISEYFMMRAKKLRFYEVNFKGKYSFQYICDAVFEHCVFDTKDAFWHAKNVTVQDSIIKGEYLAWYSSGLTFKNCKIIGTQPFCYCRKLKLINCEMIETDLCFEKSKVTAQIITPVISIKNPISGIITVPSVNEIIRDDIKSKGKIVISEANNMTN